MAGVSSKTEKSPSPEIMRRAGKFQRLISEKAQLLDSASVRFAPVVVMLVIVCSRPLMYELIFAL